MENGSFKLIGSSILVVALLTSCTDVVTPETETAVPESVPSIEASVSESETTEEETVYTGFSVETEPHENPLNEYTLEQPYDCYLILFYGTLDYNDTYNETGLEYGFDSPNCIASLQELVYATSGEDNTSITLSDVGYFQYVDTVRNEWASYSFSDNQLETIRIEAVRAVLASEGLRFGIDEIPYSYFVERFPRFTYDSFVFDKANNYLAEDDQPIEGLDNLVHPQDTENEIYLDWIIFTSCMNYNYIRSCYMFNRPYGENRILQVRDAATGKNVLVPTEAQAEQLQEDINSIPGCENIDIFTPETSEEFYACYGYYPENLLQMISYGNTSEGFAEYYNSLPEDDQNELYAPILFE